MGLKEPSSSSSSSSTASLSSDEGSSLVDNGCLINAAVDGIQKVDAVMATDEDSTITPSVATTSTSNENDANDDSLGPLKICFVVEPSPITYCCGYATVYQPLFQHILDAHPEDDVELVTCEAVEPTLPDSWPYNTKRTMKIHHTYGFPIFYLYPTYTLSLDWTNKVGRVLFGSKPDIIHTTSPSAYSFMCILYSRLLGVPLFISYHTHLPMIPQPFLLGDDNKEALNDGNIGRRKVNKPVAQFFVHVLEWLGMLEMAK